ncbi:uncharacterized protein LOC125491747 [Beta vulgaris subsp. vulgaris]|uniref:uncharacterized protein LOC125491747 n=1 Tax=Beta vulgaris subsp. vulgaris TaxID=3555 RepID=UPI002036CA8C|nr:uncharacterized protein LOC125491747 [Beta vulgaris subsp. vulgaris]
MSGLSKLGITLTSIFSFLLFSLLTQLLYLFWRRRQQSRRKSTRIEPTTATLPASTTAQNAMHSELFKLEGSFYGPPSRVLFTIKEEEIETDEVACCVVEDKSCSGVSLGEHFGNFQFSQIAGDSPEVIIVMGENYSDFDVEPPFLTPCASPPYFTPSPSPNR